MDRAEIRRTSNHDMEVVTYDSRQVRACNFVICIVLTFSEVIVQRYVVGYSFILIVGWLPIFKKINKT